jgi:HlyD family secretion protein
MKRYGIILLVVLLACGGGYWFFSRRSANGKGVQFKTARVDRGEVIQGESASGTVEPVELIQVGTQISGVIEKLNVDFNSKVKAGEVIARLDSRRLASQVAQDEAAVAKTQADLERAKSAVVQARSEIDRVRAQAAQTKSDVNRVEALLAQSKADLERQRQLVERRLTSRADLDAAVALAGSLEAQVVSARAAVDQSAAQLASAEAALVQSQAQVAVGEAAIRQAKAQLEGDRVNLGYATIVSPVDGVVVSRNVEVGQTVAASLSAPTLFVIARDLTKIQIETSVPEASIGRTHEGQPASFTVDAYPDRTFSGTVSQVRLASTTVSNVVTYTVVIQASNPDGILFPGMTANVIFEVARSAKDALRVPATALRLQPAAELVEARPAPAAGAVTEGAARERAGGGAGQERGARTGGGAAARGAGGGTAGKGASLVYVPTPAGLLRPVRVRPGVSDGANTVVEPADPEALKEGTEVVTAVLKAAEAATTNPFAPPRMGGPRPAGR